MTATPKSPGDHGVTGKYYANGDTCNLPPRILTEHSVVFRVGADPKPKRQLSNQSQHAFWSDPAISDAPVFVTADFVWGPDESHYSGHRYMVSAYTLRSAMVPLDPTYNLEDRYMTARMYGFEESGEVLATERQEILGRLKRVKTEAEARQRLPGK